MAVNLAADFTRSKSTKKSWDMRTPAILKSYRKSICPVTAVQASKQWRLDTGSTWIMGMKLPLGSFSWRTLPTNLSICPFSCLRTMPLMYVWIPPKSSYVTLYGQLRRCTQIYSHWRCTILEVFTIIVTVTLIRVCSFDFIKQRFCLHFTIQWSTYWTLYSRVIDSIVKGIPYTTMLKHVRFLILVSLTCTYSVHYVNSRRLHCL